MKINRYLTIAIFVITVISLHSQTFEIDIKVFLAGPYDSDSVAMTTDLNNLNFIPLVQPYSEYPWNYSGNESVTAIPNSNVVDWVLIELRQTSGEPETAISDSLLAMQAAFLLKDGSVVGIDGSSYPTFDEQVVSDLYIIVRHRNHIDVMSSAPSLLTTNVYSWDFTSGADQVHGGINGHQVVDTVNNYFGLIPMDANANGHVDGREYLLWYEHVYEWGYFPADANMNGFVYKDDKNYFWVENCAKGTQVPQ